MTNTDVILSILGLGILCILAGLFLELNDLKRVVREELWQIAKAIERKEQR